jgi:phosphoglycerate-specific signal transduction histidine kinase
MSVASYNPSSRYSANKRDRDDSSSRRHEYGILGGLKSNLSKDPSVKDPSANNDFETRSNMKSMNDEANMNRMLNEEQRKRSKVEAELSKCQVELG